MAAVMTTAFLTFGPETSSSQQLRQREWSISLDGSMNTEELCIHLNTMIKSARGVGPKKLVLVVSWVQCVWGASACSRQSQGAPFAYLQGASKAIDLTQITQLCLSAKHIVFKDAAVAPIGGKNMRLIKSLSCGFASQQEFKVDGEMGRVAA